MDLSFQIIPPPSAFREMLRHLFHLDDEGSFELMQNFPFHSFDSSPVAYLPISSASSEQFLAAIQSDGVVFSVSPNLHKIHSRTRLNDQNEDCIVTLSTVHHSELCVVVWDSTDQFYFAHFLKAEHFEFRILGKSKLSAPDPAVFLCGAAHLGSALFVVWSDGSVQYYRPAMEEGEGLLLMERFKLSGLDFGVMGKKAETEDLRSLSCGLSVCSMLNSDGTVCIFGPEFETAKLKYILLDTESGLIQDSGILDQSIIIEGPLKISPVLSKKGAFRFYINEVDYGEKLVKISPSTLATRVGIRHPSRKRKLTEEDAELTQSLRLRSESLVLSQPSWIQYLSDNQSASSNPVKFIKKANLVPNGMQGGSSLEGQSLHQRVVGVMERLERGMTSNRSDGGRLIEEAMAILEVQKSTSSVLLVDLVGNIAEYIARVSKNWTTLQQVFELSDLRSMSSCPSLSGALLDAFEYDLFAKVISKQQEMNSEILMSLLHRLLGKITNSVEVIQQTNLLKRLKNQLESQLASLEDSSEEKEVSGVEFEALKWRILAFDGFNCSEILLHSLLALPMSQGSFQWIMKSLNRQEIKQLMLYLTKWLILLLKECSTPDQVIGLEAIYKIPTLQKILEWFSAIFCSHLTVLLTEEDLHLKLREIETLLRNRKDEGKVLMAVHGMCQEILRPREKKKELTLDYQVVVFDLSFNSSL